MWNRPQPTGRSACDTTLYDFRFLLFAMRLLAYVNHLYKDYDFPYYPPAFGRY